MTWGSLVLVIVVALGAAFNQAVSGFGFALIAVPLVSLATSAAHAVVIVSLVGLPVTIVMAARHHHHVDRRAVRALLAASLAGMPLGLVVLTLVSDGVLRVVIGAAVLVLATFVAVELPIGRAARVVDVMSGFASGVLATSTGTNGPPLVFGLRARGLSAQQFRSTISVLFAVSGVVSLFGFVVTRHVDAVALGHATVALPFVGLGWFVGDRVAPRVAERAFHRLIVALLYASALSAMVSAFRRA